MDKRMAAIIGVILIVLLGAGAYAVMSKNTATKSSPSTTNSGSTSAQNTGSQNTTVTAPKQTDMNPKLSTTAQDDSANPENFTVAKGAHVSLTFNVANSGVYHGGLQFKSDDPSIDSGPIAPGQSKTVTFTADKTFSFQPYWYASQIKKDYLITINVQ